MIIYFHLLLFKPQMEIPAMVCLLLNKGSWRLSLSVPTLDSMRGLSPNTGKVVWNVTCSHVRKYCLFFPPSSVINCNLKSVSCLTMDCFVHPVFLFFFCLITDLLHLLIWATPDTNENFLAVWSRFSSLTVRSEFFSMLQKTFTFWLFVLDFQVHFKLS